MGKISTLAVKALIARNPFKRGNTEIKPCENGSWGLYLHGSCIARLYENGKLEIRDAGWRTHTTKERLNAIPRVVICQKNYDWYLDGKPMPYNTWIAI